MTTRCEKMIIIFINNNRERERERERERKRKPMKGREGNGRCDKIKSRNKADEGRQQQQQKNVVRSVCFFTAS
jgi:hypothetical protein